MQRKKSNMIDAIQYSTNQSPQTIVFFNSLYSTTGLIKLKHKIEISFLEFGWFWSYIIQIQFLKTKFKFSAVYIYIDFNLVNLKT